MVGRSTEQLHTAAFGLDLLESTTLASVLLEAQVAAAQSVLSASSKIADAANAMARTIKAGGRIHYFAAGSSGLMAAADMMELGGTFSIPAGQLAVHMAGGVPQSVEMPGDVEDATDELRATASAIGDTDTAVFISASGTTPYTVAAAEMVKPTGATLVGIANNDGAPLLDLADIAIFLKTPPEVLAGSTRLGAATAQKIALNTLSTAMAVELGHVHDGMMVNVFADNIKLKERAKGIVCNISQVPDALAQSALDDANGRVKEAILIAGLGVSPAEASAILSRTSGHLRPALEAGKHQSNRE